MKYIKYLILSLIAVCVVSCEDDDSTTDLSTVQAPTNIMAQVSITQDNSGLVSITPSAESATSFEIFFGDTPENSVELALGETTQNVYPEGSYDLRIVATGLSGLTAEAVQPINVSFQAPQNLEVSISPGSTNFEVNVTATADFETNFEFYPGEFDDENPIPFMEGETLSYSYSSVGTFQARVVALSGGAETTEVTQEVTIVNPLLLPVDFEDPTLNYNFADFGGAATSVVPNPDMSGGNVSTTVAQSIKTAGAEVFAGTTLQIDAPIDFSSLNNISLNTYAPVSGITVKLKLENATDPNTSTEIDVINTTANAWETLTFDFSGEDLTKEYSKVIVFFDFGNTGDGSTYYFDDIKLAQSTAATFELFEDFEGTPPAFTEFGGMAAPQVLANPDASGENTTANVVEFVKTSGAETFAGAFFELNGLAIDFSGTNQLRLKSYSPTVDSEIRVKLENQDASITTEVFTNTTVVNQWETLTFNFADAPDAQYVRVVVFYDFDNPGNGETYYFDEMEVGEGELISTAPSIVLEDFEGNPPVFTSFEGAGDVQIVPNPNPSDVNNSAMSAEVVKGDGAQTFAGSFFEFDTTLDLDTFSTIRIRTINPAAGQVVKLRLENADNSVGFEVDVTNTVANEWEVLEYDFSDAPDADFVRIVIFFDFGNTGTGTTHNFDEFELTN